MNTVNESGPSDRHDPLEGHYANLEKYSMWLDRMSWFAAFLFLIYAVAHLEAPEVAKLAKLAFILVTAVCFIGNIAARYAWSHAIDRRRRRMLLSEGLGAGFELEKSKGYWSAKEKRSFKKLGLMLSENTYFYPRLIQAELLNAFTLSVILLIVLVVAIRFAEAEVVELVAVVVLFTEFGLGRPIRMVWMKSKFEACHEAALRVTRNFPIETEEGKLEILDVLCEYETIKARGGYRPKNSTFRRMNPSLTKKWESVLAGL